MTAFDKSKDAANYLASKFLSRPDIKETHLPSFVDWALELCTTGKIITKTRMTKSITSEAQKNMDGMVTRTRRFKEHL